MDATSPHPSADIWHDRERYVAQVEFVNARLLEWLDGLLASVDSPPVVILLGDHGTASTRTWDPEAPAFVRERLSTLSAYLLPCPGDRPYPTISPVNAFRLVLRACFGEELELLPERHFFSGYGRPLDPIEVTDRVRGGVR